MAKDRVWLVMALAAFTVALFAASCLFAMDSPQAVDGSIASEPLQPPVAKPEIPMPSPSSAVAAAPSPTPLSIPPTETLTPIPTPGPTPTATATLPPLPPMETILLLGSDERGTSSGGVWLTDAIMVVTLDAENKRVGMFGIPRDLWVSPPTMWEMRVNQVDYLGEQNHYPGGGPALLADTLREPSGL